MALFGEHGSLSKSVSTSSRESAPYATTGSKQSSLTKPKDVYYFTVRFIVVDVAARVAVPAKDQVTEHVPAVRVFTDARVKIPPVLSCVATDPTVHTLGVVDTALSRCPILNRPEF